MSEFMGLIRGTYEAKQEGFLPGGNTFFLLLQAAAAIATTSYLARVSQCKAEYCQPPQAALEACMLLLDVRHVMPAC